MSAETSMDENKFDRVVENVVRGGTYGALAGAAAALLLFSESEPPHPPPPTPGPLRSAPLTKSLPPRRDANPVARHLADRSFSDCFLHPAGHPSSRSCVFTFGLGCGMGAAYSDAAKDFGALFEGVKREA